MTVALTLRWGMGYGGQGWRDGLGCPWRAGTRTQVLAAMEKGLAIPQGFPWSTWSAPGTLGCQQSKEDEKIPPPHPRAGTSVRVLF